MQPKETELLDLCLLLRFTAESSWNSADAGSGRIGSPAVLTEIEEFALTFVRGFMA